jgi:dethiobiotin synthetase
MKSRGLFITGTDTGVGKTLVTVGLMRLLRGAGLNVVGMKPVATGARWEGGRLINDDALLLRENASFPVPYEQINPYAFEPPVSPHIAARKAEREIDLDSIAKVYKDLERSADCVLVEGVGGWEVPLNGRQRVADLAARLDLPVVLVVGMRLGGLNQGFLTANALARSGVGCLGWIANQIERDFLFPDENLETLKFHFEWPLLAFLPFIDPNSTLDGEIFPASQRDEILRVFCASVKFCKL